MALNPNVTYLIGGNDLIFYWDQDYIIFIILIDFKDILQDLRIESI